MLLKLIAHWTHCVLNRVKLFCCLVITVLLYDCMIRIWRLVCCMILYTQVVLVEFAGLFFKTTSLPADIWMWCMVFGVGELAWGQVGLCGWFVKDLKGLMCFQLQSSEKVVTWFSFFFISWHSVRYYTTAREKSKVTHWIILMRTE